MVAQTALLRVWLVVWDVMEIIVQFVSTTTGVHVTRLLQVAHVPREGMCVSKPVVSRCTLTISKRHAPEMPTPRAAECLSEVTAEPEAQNFFSEAVVLEICCGTAGVIASLKRKGFSNCIAIDKTVPKLPKAAVWKLDLSSRSNQELVLSWIRSPQVKAVAISPPCGSASQARYIPLPNDLNPPAPVRPLLQPDGLEGLTGTDLLRVVLANTIHSCVAGIPSLFCLQRPPSIPAPPSVRFAISCHALPSPAA